MVNARGTYPSRGHISLNPNKHKSYWSFSWHEIGIYDLSASIDRILSITNFTKLNYIGFSQGVTSFLALTSTRPEYNDKIIEANLLGPAAFMKNVQNAFYRTVSIHYKTTKRLIAALKIHKLDMDNDLLLRIAKVACEKTELTTPHNCKLILSIINSDQINCVSKIYLNECH